MDWWNEVAHQQMVWLAAHRHPWLDVLFTWLTKLGSEGFLLFFLAVSYWLVDRHVFARATGMLLVSALINTAMKGLLMVPRPEVLPLVEASGWSFPSGHAQTGIALWGWLAVETVRAGRSRYSSLVAVGLVCLAVLVAGSRLYLGVHYPHDVVMGFLLGVVQVAIMMVWTRNATNGQIPRRFHRGLWMVWCLALGLSMGVLDSYSADLMIRLLGVSLGFGLAIGWATWMGWSDVPTDWWGRIGLLIFGIGGVLAVYKGLKEGLQLWGIADHPMATMTRYVLLGIWVAVGVPAIAALGLEGSRRDA
ncbi:MAG: phosphatase PAP2 family protein [Myxococcales bacterium]|nr:phosphatase PAP2 family protein [Myxococcales bacterium]